MTTKERTLLAWMAEQFYCNGVSQAEIAKKLRSSKATVCRQLRRAVEEGIIRFEITVPTVNDGALERKLEERFGLRRAFVVESGPDEEGGDIDALGRAGALFLQEILKDGDVFGVSGGSATNAVIDHLDAEHCRQRIEVLQLSGVFSSLSPKTAFFVAQSMARKFNCAWSPLLLPAVADSSDSRDILMSGSSFQELEEKFKRINVAMFGVGSLLGEKPDSELYRNGHIDEGELARLREEGAVGVLLSHIIGAAGQRVTSPISERIISMPLENLKKVEICVGIAGGAAKVLPILSVLKGGWINHLVTDSKTALALLDAAQPTGGNSVD